MHPVVATGPDGAGWIAWQGDRDAPIRVMRLATTSLGDATDSSTKAAGPTTTTHTLKVGGATLSFQVPAGCVNLGLISDLEIPTVNSLFIHTQPAHLQKIRGVELSSSDRNIERARYLRSNLNREGDSRNN